ncbi:MAG: hypothetical protein ABI068_08850 [Ktedonobacterales bacterium]
MMAGDDVTTQWALLLDTDLFFVVKVTETLKHAGYAVRTVRRAEEFARWLAEEPPTVALVNTAARGVDWETAIHAAQVAGVPVVAFGPHVDLATQAAAREAGATRVISNSKLASDLPAILARTLNRNHADTGAEDAEVV